MGAMIKVKMQPKRKEKMLIIQIPLPIDEVVVDTSY
jgi:hypothetical protein